MKNLVKIIWIIFGLALLVGLFSCSPTKRLLKLRAKHPELFEAKADTVWKKDTTIIEGVRKDTVIYRSRDTVVIVKDRLQIKYFERNDSAYISGECLPDTIYKEVPYVTEKETVVKEGVPWWVYFIIAGLVILLLIFRRK